MGELSKDELDQLLIRAATIDELLSDEFVTVRGEKSTSDTAALRLAEWCRSSTSGDWDLFARRLARDGLTFDHVLTRFSKVRRNPGIPDPTWLADAAWVFKASGRDPRNVSIDRFASADNPIAFQDLFLPIVEDAEEELRSNLAEDKLSMLSAQARNQLCHTLIASLSALSAGAVYQSYTEWSTPEAPTGRPSTAAAGHAEPQLREYGLFIEHMKHTGFSRLFTNKPVLLRLLASMTRQWITSTGEFVERLSRDVWELRRGLIEAPSDALIDSVRGDLSDLHNFGRSVLLVEFSGGSRVVYKPKDMRLDALWFRLTSSVNAAGAPVSLRAPRVLVRGGYGWSEFIDTSECSHPDDFDMFYRRAGAWLALFHVFGGTDIHQENVIAAGSHPVSIDHEMLFQTGDLTAPTNVEETALELAVNVIRESVIRVGLLPSYTRTLEHGLFALGGLDNPLVRSRETYWENINTSRMQRRKRVKAPVRSPNVPHLSGTAASLGDFRGALIEGFVTYSDFILQNKKKLLEDWFDTASSGLAARCILRPTQFYQLLITRLRDHSKMHDGAVWSATLDFVARFSDPDDQHDHSWPLLRAERNALADLNVPFFHMPIESMVVSDHFGIEARFAIETGLGRARQRLKLFDASEIGWQSDVIRVSTISAAGPNAALPSVPHTPSQMPDTALLPATQRSIALDAASDIAHEFATHAFVSGGSAAWIGLHWLAGSEVCQLKPLGFDLYDGAPGVALFLAAHASTTEESKSARLALAGITAVRSNLRSQNAARWARSLGLGGGTGLGSIVYALTVLGSLLGEEELHADAAVAANLVTDDLIAADRAFDVVCGSAGCILGLLKLFRETGDENALDRAVLCGKHLLRLRSTKSGYGGMWIGAGIGSRPLTGMSHGAAGFALAFASLDQAVGLPEFATAARDCIDFESRTFSNVHGNWPDLRQQGLSEDKEWPCQWCHGAGGIGLGRIGMLKRGYADEATLTSNIYTAVARAERAFPHKVDTLCCGSLGNIELISEAGLLLQRADLTRIACHRFTEVIGNAMVSGGYRWGVGEQRFNLGMFRGTAGVGYTALRRVNTKLPNILMWE